MPEPYLKELSLNHRFLLAYSYKIIYRIIDEKIAYITDVFPTRKDPQKIKTRAEKTSLI